MNKTEKIIIAILSGIVTFLALTALFNISYFSKNGFDTVGFISMIFLPKQIAPKLAFSVLIAVAIILCMDSGNLDVKSKVVGDGQYGKARFATQKEKEKDYTVVTHGEEKKSGIVIERTLGKPGKWIVDTTEDSMLLLAIPGGGKTKDMMIPNITYNGMIALNDIKAAPSMIMLDNKGELLTSCGNPLKSFGYNVLYLDFRHPDKSYKYNLMHNVNKALDE